MTRRMVYGIGLWVFLAGISSPVLCSLSLANAFTAVALTFTSMALPSWISYTSPTTSSQKPIHVSYGLHRRCSSLSGSCTPFPVYEDCHGEDRYFCSMWRSVGFLMNFSVVLELATFVAFAVVLLGGRSNREGGWKMCVSMLGVVMVCQIAAMAIVVCGTAIQYHMLMRDMLTEVCYRLSSSTTTTASLLAGSWTRVGFSARFLGSCCCSTSSASVLLLR